MGLDGLPQFEAAIYRVSAALTAEARSGVAEAGALLERTAKSVAPVRTGTLRRGIIEGPVMPFGVAGAQVKVGPTIIYSRRVELGFLGYDSIGRFYGPPRNPSMHPYFLPSWNTMPGPFESIMASHLARALETA